MGLLIVFNFPGETPHGETVRPDRPGRGRGADRVGVYRGPDIQFSSTVMSIFSRAVSRTRSSWLTWPTSPWSLSTGSKVRTASKGRGFTARWSGAGPASPSQERGAPVRWVKSTQFSVWPVSTSVGLSPQELRSQNIIQYTDSVLAFFWKTDHRWQYSYKCT